MATQQNSTSSSSAGAPPRPGAPSSTQTGGGTTGAPPPPPPPPTTTTRTTRGAPTRNTVDIVPNTTLYISNIDDKINKKDLRACIYELCISYGIILDININKKKRGICFVVFNDINSSSSALKGLQGKIFLGKCLRIQYAYNKSDAYLQYINQYKIRKPNTPRVQPTITKEALPAGIEGGATLFVEDIPTDMNKNSIEVLFNEYKGFINIKYIKGRGVAFIDFINKNYAEKALHALQGFKITQQHSLKITHVDRDKS